MKVPNSSSLARSLLLVLGLGAFAQAVVPDDAFARAGRSRSVGRTPTRSYNNNTYTAPNANYSKPGATNGYNNSYATPQPQRPGSSGVMKGVAAGAAAGVAGAVVGNMLYDSVGNANPAAPAANAAVDGAAPVADANAATAGFSGTGAAPAQKSSGFVWMYWLLLLGGGFLLFRWWKNRQKTMAYAGMGNGYSGNGGYTAYSPAPAPTYPASTPSYPAQSGFRALAPEGISPDQASDIFFRIQGAYTRRDLGPVQQLLGREVQDTLNRDVEELKQQKLINRLENISVRKTEVLSTWQDEGLDLSTVRFTANLLDYTVDEQSGRVIEGSDNNPVKFEEDWTFAKSPRSNDWQLVSIQQV